MKTKLSKKRAISTVLTTVIILVSSVVLGSGVVLYGTSLFQSGTQSESISITDVKVWVHSTSGDGLAWGATKIRNTGDKLLSVDKIQIRGGDVPFTQWYPDTDVSSSLFQKTLNHTGWTGSSGLIIKDGTGCQGGDEISLDLVGNDAAVDTICATTASGPVPLSPGATVIIYFKLTNGTIVSLDTGINTTVGIFAGKAGVPQSVTVVGKS